MFATPVLFLVFNRPEKTSQVFERIRSARPVKLFIAADGPRHNKEGDVELCDQVRKGILDHIDWPCEIHTLFRKENMGCRLAVSSAINWFFENVEDGIILEDDCLPDLSFFSFCAELLEYYRHDENVMMVSGDNFLPEQRGTGSYYFSRYTHIWGWATWRRAWKHYDLSMEQWPAFRKEKRFSEFLPSPVYEKVEKIFDAAFAGKTTTWDTQWMFSCWAHRGLSVMPNVNLVSNIDPAGTHMKVYDPCIDIPSHAMHFPLLHPSEVKPDEVADRYTQSYIAFRDWRRVLALIISYLRKKRGQGWGAFLKALWLVLGNCVAEIRHRCMVRLA